MKILITTEREIRDDDYWVWIDALNKVGVKINGQQLLDTGIGRIEDDLGHTKAITTYEIVMPAATKIDQITNWVNANVPTFFNKAAFDLTVDHRDLVIKIYSDMSADEFRNCRHHIHEKMLQDGQQFLYNNVKIFQRHCK